MKTTFVLVAALAAAVPARADGPSAGDAEFSVPAAAEPAAETAAPPARKILSLHAYADVESAYVCRGYIWDTRPYSAQFADVEADFGAFGRVDAFVWTMSAMSGSGHAARMSRYAYAEIDYHLRYSFDLDLAENWRLRNSVSRQWVTNPGYCGGHTLFDWQAMQALQNPWITPYWRLRAIRKPIEETYWAVGVKRDFRLLDDLTLTVDFFGDLGDRRHFENLYGPKPSNPDGHYRGGLQALNLVFRLDWRLTENLGLFAFVGQFCLVSDDARDAAKASPAPESRRDLTYCGIGAALDF